MEYKRMAASNIRCGHWEAFAKKIEEWFATFTAPFTAHLFFYTEMMSAANLPVDGQGGILHVVFGPRPWDVPDLAVKTDGYLRAQYRVGGMIVNIAELGECPEQPQIDSAIRLLERVLPLAVESDPERRAAMLAEAAAKRRIVSRDAYVRECSARFEKTVKSTRDAITSGTVRITQLQAELVKKIREVSGAERKLVQLEASRGGEEAKYAQEFDKLWQVPHVVDVQAASGVIKVFTDTLYCVDPRSGQRHEIGKFRIDLNVNSGSPQWFNLTRKVHGYRDNQMAPHIWSDGNACLGNTTEVFPELLGNYEFAAAAMVAINFVESVNVDDPAGRNISNWPVAE